MNDTPVDRLKAIRDAFFFFWLLGLVLSIVLGLSGQTVVGSAIFALDLVWALGMMVIYVLEYDEIQHEKLIHRGATWPIRG